MPELKNARHEKFAQLVAIGLHYGPAFKEAGFKAKNADVANTGGSRLVRNAQVSARIAEIRLAAGRRAEVTLDQLLEEAERARVLAMGLGQASAAVSAVKAKAVLAGHWIERSERTVANDPDALTDAEIAERLAAIEHERRGAAAPQSGKAPGNSRKPH